MSPQMNTIRHVCGLLANGLLCWWFFLFLISMNNLAQSVGAGYVKWGAYEKIPLFYALGLPAFAAVWILFRVRPRMGSFIQQRMFLSICATLLVPIPLGYVVLPIAYLFSILHLDSNNIFSWITMWIPTFSTFAYFVNYLASYLWVNDD